MSQTIAADGLRALAAGWLAAGKRVIGPRRVKRDCVLYTRIGSADELVLEGARPANSIKEFLFPKTEKLYGYKIDGNKVDLVETWQPPGEQIVVAARPCDAAALPVLDRVFDWDYRDGFYQAWRAATTVVTLACATFDEHCFCTSVGLGPAAENGSDVLLVPTESGYEVRALTEKGRALLASVSEVPGEAAIPSGPPARIDPAAVRSFVKEHFEDPFWRDAALACFGCGACAAVCPTCHCFDIVDEGNAAGGARIRNWDSCQHAMFTLHASGHNPRNDQAARQRQRIYHKFHVYPEKFGAILCTGCGNCTRNCPAGLGVLTLANEICHAEHLPA